MKIYTKQGDEGITGLWGGSRVPKDHIRIKAYGAIDELNSFIGLSLSTMETLPACALLAGPGSFLRRLQSELFVVGAELASPTTPPQSLELVDSEATARIEQAIDLLEKDLPRLQNFIVPGGSSAASYLHVCRTVCRRAEREIITLSTHEKVRPELIRYINRLSDYFFVAARKANALLQNQDNAWTPHLP